MAKYRATTGPRQARYWRARLGGNPDLSLRKKAGFFCGPKPRPKKTEVGRRRTRRQASP
jgi:hypothetical protein